MKAFAEKLVVPFEEDAWPSIECPVCGNGHLTIAPKADGSRKADWRITKVTSSWSDWGDPTDIKGTFSADLLCSNTSDCGDSIHVSGDVAVDYSDRYRHTSDEEPFETLLTVEWFHPSLRIVDVPDDVPGSVSVELDNVGALIWSNPDAALWSLRKAVEMLLSEQGIDRLKPDGYPFSLNKRLEMFGAAHPQFSDVVEMLQAVRWVGNEGTHASGHSGKGVLHVIKFVELALESLYSESGRDAALAHARKINAAEGYVAPD